jgi:hypothetical protein
VVVPLGLGLVPITGPYARRFLASARTLQPVGALAAISSFLVPPGAAAALLAAGWLLVCAVAGLAGLAELVESRSVGPGRLLSAAALGFLTVGGAWLVASRGAINLGYSPPVVELTAVHFHYAGFAATLMSALAYAVLRSRVCAAAGLLVVVGTPLTAAGISTETAALTVVGPILLATGLLTNAALTAFLIAPRRPSRARWLLIVSSAAVVLPMLLGVDYAAARVLPIPSLDLRTMALVHGDLNAVAYALIGLTGWTQA